MGTLASPMTIDVPGFARSASPVIFESCGTAITSLLPAKTWGLDSLPSAASWSGSLVFADANTFGLAPWRICAASWSDPAKLNLSLACLNDWAQVVKASFSDAAADTVSVGVEPPPPSLLLPQPATTSTTAHSAARAGSV